MSRNPLDKYLIPLAESKSKPVENYILKQSQSTNLWDKADIHKAFSLEDWMNTEDQDIRDRDTYSMAQWIGFTIQANYINAIQRSTFLRYSTPALALQQNEIRDKFLSNKTGGVFGKTYDYVLALRSTIARRIR